MVEMLLQRTAQAQVIMDVLPCIQVACSVLTVLSLALTYANSFITLLLLAWFTVLSYLANGRKGLVNVTPITFPLLLHLSRKVGLSLQALKPSTMIVATSSSSASLQIEFPFTLSKRQL